MNYYQRHLGDYASAAGHLSALEHGIYNLLIDWYYACEQPIPDATAHRIARSPKEAVEPVLLEFFQRDGDVWRHKRIDRELESYRAKAALNREAGKLGGRPKKNTTETMVVSPETMVVQKITLTNNQEPITNNQYKSKRRAFTAPTPNEVQTYATDAGLVIDPDRFVDYYASKGWKVGESPMKNWQAAVRNWARNNTGVSHGSNNRPGSNPSADRSAAGRVRANVARARAERAAASVGGDAMAVDGVVVRAQVD